MNPTDAIRIPARSAAARPPRPSRILAIDPGTVQSAWLERFWSKVDRGPTCWLWTGTLRPDGYPVFWLDHRMARAHRLAYELVVGPIPAGLELDHLCKVPQCVNPAHLEPVTRTENMRRADTGWRTRIRACASGHDFTPENTLMWRGWRLCRACKAAAARRYRARKAASS